MNTKRIRSFLTLPSLLLTAAVAALWARSLTVADWLGRSNAAVINGRYARTSWVVESCYGYIGIIKENRVPIDDESASWLRRLDEQSGLGWSFGPVAGYPLSWSGLREGLSRFGFPSGVDKQGRTNRAWNSVEAPDWFLLLLVSIPAQLALIRWIRARRIRHRSGFPIIEKQAHQLTEQ